MINCTFEDGGKASLRHVTVGAIVLNRERNKILLGKRALHLLNGGKYNLIGGYLDRNETTSQVVLREVLEETGYNAKIISLFRINDSPNRPREDRQNVDFAFIVEALDKVGEMDSESTEVKWFNLDSLPAPDEFAFDHYETVQLYKDYIKTNRSLPIIGK